jgi:chromosome segregation ATPase
MDDLETLKKQLIEDAKIIKELKCKNKVLQETFEDTLIEHSNLLDSYLDLEEERDELARKCRELKEKLDYVNDRNEKLLCIIKKYTK